MPNEINFSVLKLVEPILLTLNKLGYTNPSPIQAQAIPHVLAGKDVMAAAQTGTGKTAAFTLPILQRLAEPQKAQQKGNQVRVLVLVPTRELAAQVADNVRQYGQNLRVKTVVVFGGVGINPQMQKLRGGADVLIATPGRLLDLYNKNAMKFEGLEVLVLDEADRMLDMGFIHDIKRIERLLPKQRQNLLFSATFSDEIRALARGIVRQPVEVSVSPPNSTVKAVKQSLIAVEKSDKRQVLTRLIEENDWHQVLVFARTKHGADRLARQLTKSGIETMAIHGNKSQGARTRALAAFKSADLRVLVATDIAARGIDIDQLPQVVNFDLPQVAEDYVHRIGRTGRAGASGQAISLVSHDEHSALVNIERLIKQHIPRVELDGYEPLNALPAAKPLKPSSGGSKAKQNKSRRRPNAAGASAEGKGAQRRRSSSGRQDRGAASKPRRSKHAAKGRSAGSKAKSTSAGKA